MKIDAGSETLRIFSVLNDIPATKNGRGSCYQPNCLALTAQLVITLPSIAIKHHEYVIHHPLPNDCEVEKEFPHFARMSRLSQTRSAVDPGPEPWHANGTTHSELACTATGVPSLLRRSKTWLSRPHKQRSAGFQDGVPNRTQIEWENLTHDTSA
jgi:hypothetical protein